ncbi:aminopeptidase P family protein [Alkalilacustris brevis]|uniref:aminopeptidase P family protein n=1 Tax=Alkalilacustris brevis TaxID=2026338 RepID=UPI000E0D1A80|nr:aminopeptidase P family protein [Alkalilacustris brevis]
MFQNFTATTRPEQGPPRLAKLRAELAGHGLDGFIVPRADAHQGEYVAPCDERLAWLTGFTGSAGFCIVLTGAAGLFVDGRYRVQARAQLDLAHFTPLDWPATQPGAWLRAQLPEGGTIGFDSWLHGRDEIARLESALKGSGIRLTRCTNMVDAVWHDRPAPPAGPIRTHPEALAGRSGAEKRAEIAESLRAADQRAVVLPLPDSLCWLLNIRGSDIPRNPIVQAFGILHDDARLDLFLNPERLDDDLRAHLGDDVTPRPPEAFAEALRALTGPVRLDPSSAPLAISDALTEAGVAIAWAEDPCMLPKARKTEPEIAGMRAAHLRDGTAMVNFLAWLDERAEAVVKGGTQLAEIDVVRALEGFRRDTGALRDISFETIAGSGPNGAIVHYRVTEDTNRPLRAGEVLLVDSGGQYDDGTTDITRTVPIGPAGDEPRAAFTRVLQGMIAISRLRWPEGLAGRDLDALARYPLWLAGQDYDHGTGHGVGAALSVHEGPQRLSRASTVPIEPGMILSNEPGYYREGAFGIRIENLVVVRKAAPRPGADDRPMLDFETLTHVPIDRRLIDTAALSAGERAWLDAYHAETRARLAPLVEGAAREWLLRATRPL